MRTSPEINELATALALAQAEMPNAVFNRSNPYFNSKYADLAAIREATLPALTKHGLCIVQSVMRTFDMEATEDGLVLYSRLLHKSGQWIEGEMPITVGTPQAMGSQLTYFRRYLWSAQTGVTADDDDDANVATAESKRQGASGVTLGTPQLSKAKSKPLYVKLMAEVRAKTTKDALTKWALENTDDIYSMHKDYQQWFRDEYGKHLATLMPTGEAIDDAVPEAPDTETTAEPDKQRDPDEVAASDNDADTLPGGKGDVPR